MLPFFGPVRTVQQIIAVDRQNDMESWDYKLPKKHRGSRPEVQEAAGLAQVLLAVQEGVPQKEAGTKKWKVVGRHSVVPGARHDGALAKV